MASVFCLEPVLLAFSPNSGPLLSSRHSSVPASSAGPINQISEFIFSLKEDNQPDT